MTGDIVAIGTKRLQSKFSNLQKEKGDVFGDQFSPFKGHLLKVGKVFSLNAWRLATYREKFVKEKQYRNKN